MNINHFLERGKNKLICQIIDVVVIAILSVISLYFIVNLIGADTMDKYLKVVGKNGLGLLIFGGVDFLLIMFTKPLFGFTSVVENHRARKVLKQQEKESKRFIEETAKETLRKAREARKAEKARAKEQAAGN